MRAHDHDAIGELDASALDLEQQPAERVPFGQAVLMAQLLRQHLEKIEDDLRTEYLRRRGSEDEGIGDVIDLDRRVPATQAKDREQYERHDEERTVLDQVTQLAASTMV